MNYKLKRLDSENYFDVFSIDKMGWYCIAYAFVFEKSIPLSKLIDDLLTIHRLQFDHHTKEGFIALLKVGIKHKVPADRLYGFDEDMLRLSCNPNYDKKRINSLIEYVYQESMDIKLKGSYKMLSELNKCITKQKDNLAKSISPEDYIICSKFLSSSSLHHHQVIGENNKQKIADSKRISGINKVANDKWENVITDIHKMHKEYNVIYKNKKDEAQIDVDLLRLDLRALKALTGNEYVKNTPVPNQNVVIGTGDVDNNVGNDNWDGATSELYETQKAYNQIYTTKENDTRINATLLGLNSADSADYYSHFKVNKIV